MPCGFFRVRTALLAIKKTWPSFAIDDDATSFGAQHGFGFCSRA
jgi:hypothetical protein